ncbi:GMC oxidoreductase [Sphaerobolus stellatus SS14]|nr:GMC oxidoreductase [Sphaerobolus stellatus SS14]
MTSLTSKSASTFLAKEYDILIIGGGTAGLALASRLSEDSQLSIGVIEAGTDKYDDPVIQSGGGWMKTYVERKYQWGFNSTVQDTLLDSTKGDGKQGRAMSLPRGKMLGGTSCINALLWMRASKEEYDSLSSIFSNPGWSFDELLPYFIKSQSHTPQPTPLFPNARIIEGVHGIDGPLKTSQNWYQSSLHPPFVAAVQSLSQDAFAINSNPDAGNPLGVQHNPRALDSTTALRQSSNASYLKAAEGRQNLNVLLEAFARRIILEKGDRGEEWIAKGVEFESNGEIFIVHAKREVILCAGVYQTPQLLELSGIGLPSILSKHDIPVKVNLPVGENLQDHLFVSIGGVLKDAGSLKQIKGRDGKLVLPKGLTIEYVGTGEEDLVKGPQNSTTGSPCLLTTLQPIVSTESLVELLGALKSLIENTNNPLTKLQYELQLKWLSDPQSQTSEVGFLTGALPGFPGIPTADGGMSFWMPTCIFHPTARGSVHISSADPVKAPTIDPKVLNDFDLKAFVHATKYALKIFNSEPLSSILVPQTGLKTDAEIEKYIKETANPLFHPVGTAPMAPKELGGVVDSTLKIYGTQNLRIVDASIFPLQIGTMPQATIYAVAEKAADIIKSVLKP